MIYIGLTGWGDHDDLYPDKINSRDKLKAYASHFPIVEIDSSFYAVQPEKNYQKWASETPEGFRFIVKAYQGMTGHQRGENPFDSREEMFGAFKKSLTPIREANKLQMVLFQFPPWFDCKKEHVDILRYCKEHMEDIPVALEFRNQTWYLPQYYDKTLDFMRNEGWIHTVCDEPQAGIGSVPIVMEATDPETTFVRLHGRNTQGWLNPGDNKKWREVRYLYHYNKQELQEWKERLKRLEQMSKNIFLVFNNNSGGDAAENAKELIEMLEIEYTKLNPRQMDLFE
ncbi:DUF72 domain-containing protein [Pseudalkalibacillus caeni]|uniref:DUF72 domain-containing protein n=1 Tax=Exobacillus caeni TaxID=2574798 RepID=A0A5R9F929_9BACL|nr:DUF72 domain-containing protein [Pseudalkalibacillus caeni]TLS38816.1 DUF72 domain-containing protein [Pseudalkalibacillus caeni]